MKLTRSIRQKLSKRVPTTLTAVTLLVGDFVALFAFVAVGQYTHGYFFWEHPGRTVLLLAPLLCGWLLVGLLAGVVSESSLASYRTTVLKLLAAWVLVALFNGLVRKTAIVPGSAPPSFLAVSIVFGLFFLGSWRLGATIVFGPRTSM